MAQLAVHRPFNEGNLHHNLRLYPVRANAGQAFGFGERGLWDFDFVKTLAQIEQQFSIEAGADLPGEDEVIVVKVSDKKRAETDAATLKVGETTNDQFLRRLALHLQPVRRAAVL